MIPLPAHAKTLMSRVRVPTRVLVIDSEPLVRWSICAALAAEGFDAVAASDAGEASRLAIEWPPPRVVVMDLRRPDEDSADLLARRADYPDCRFLIMTTESRAGGMRVRSDGIEVIEKPFNIARIVDRVARLAAGEP